MEDEIRNKIIKTVENIADESVLMQVMEDVAFYASEKDIVDDLSASQVKELEEAIKQADNNDVINWSDFKKEINEWHRK